MSSCGSCANAAPRRMRKDHQVLTMEVEMEQTMDEIKRMQGCLNNLVSVLTLPAIWSGHESSQIVRTLLDVLLGMLRLDFAYVRVSDAIDGTPIEILRSARRRRWGGAGFGAGAGANDQPPDHRGAWGAAVGDHQCAPGR